MNLPLSRPSWRRRWFARLILLAAILLFPQALFAHPANLPCAIVSVRADGTVQVVIHCDLPAYLLNDNVFRVSDDAMNQLLDGPPAELQRRLEQARLRLLHGIALMAAPGRGSVERVEMPTLAEVRERRNAGATPALPLMMDITVRGRLSRDSGSLSLRFPQVLGELILTIERPREEPTSEVVTAGAFSSPMPIHLELPADSQPSRSTAPPADETASHDPTPAPFAPLSRFMTFVLMGFHHIMPEGLDHILFILGLCLLNSRPKPLFLQITAFTIAHSLTLALSLYGVFRLPPSVVEPVIAISIAFVAIENLATTRLTPWRPFLVFAFGLVHGLGFAGALQDLGLARHDFLGALLGFNLGVELGQLSVVALAFLAVGSFRNRPCYRRFVALPASAGIAVVAVFWTVQRMT